jgi:hypothetical protein
MKSLAGEGLSRIIINDEVRGFYKNYCQNPKDDMEKMIVYLMFLLKKIANSFWQIRLMI